VSGYFLFKRKPKKWQVTLSIVAVVSLALIGTYFMLAFREVGLADFSLDENRPENLFVDNNIVVISKLTEVFPDAVDYLGLEVPFQAITKPIPRALWPSKPEGLSFGTEDVFSAQATTIASTFIGESYMAGGLVGIVIASVLLGAFAGWWNHMGSNQNDDFKLLVYVSGFVAAALSMRSILQVVPAVLPTVVFWAYGRVWLYKQARVNLAE
jgi:oligosaccharide repeat unit polymerase